MPSESSLTHPAALPRRAWVPVPVLLLTILVLWAWGPAGSYPARGLMFACQLVFMTLASWVTVYFLARSFLAEGAAGLLLVSAGIVIWGLSGVFASAFASADVNQSITIHNLCVWLAAALQLFGVLLGSRVRPVQQRAAWALAAIAAVTCLLTLIAVATTAGWTPTFFVQGQGGTLVRQTLLASASAMFLLSAVVLSGSEGRARSSFADWYRLGLLLMAIGLLGVMVQAERSSVVGWVGVVTQWLGGIYLVIASMAAVREAKATHISLAVAPRAPLLRYGLAVVFVAAAWAIRLLFFQDLGSAQVDGLEAFVAAERFRPHVALLDIGMPKLDGYEVCRRIRQQDWGRKMVLIAHTGWGEVPRVSEAGFDGHLTKPVDYAALTNLLDNLSDHARA